MHLSLYFLLLLADAPGKTPEGWKQFDRAEETRLALSAAPLHLRDKAGVYALDNGRFQQVRPAQNGFTCVLHRVETIHAPECYDAEGSATTLRVVLREMELALQGKKSAEARETVAKEIAAGKLLTPRRAGIVYMLSDEFFDHRHGQSKKVFPPHLMFYAPGLKNADIGALPEHQNDPRYPFVLSEGRPFAYIIVVPHDLARLRDGK